MKILQTVKEWSIISFKMYFYEILLVQYILYLDILFFL